MTNERMIAAVYLGFKQTVLRLHLEQAVKMANDLCATCPPGGRAEAWRIRAAVVDAHDVLGGRTSERGDLNPMIDPDGEGVRS